MGCLGNALWFIFGGFALGMGCSSPGSSVA